MTGVEVGRTRFVDGMRVAREHLEHLQDVLLGHVAGGRETVGLGKVCYGLQVTVQQDGSVSVAPGLAIDAQGRALAVPDVQTPVVDFGAGTTVHLVLLHALRAEGLVGGVATLLFDDVTIETRQGSPPYQDDAVVFARLDKQEAGVSVTQLGEWYLPPLDHGHTGTFVVRQGRWRYDGDPVGASGAPLFDSGFLEVATGGGVTLVHGLNSMDLAVQVQARRADAVVTVQGLGQSFWYELPDAQRIRLARSGEGDPLELRASIWPLSPAPGPELPIADPGLAQVVELGEPFVLDGSDSTAFGGRRITKFEWTEIT
jgi:hypothetical protein